MVQSPQRKVDLDLDELQPPARTFRKDGVVYELPGEIPIPTVIEALQVMSTLEDPKVDASAAFTKMYDIVLDLIRQKNPDVDRIMLGSGEVQQLMGLIVGGAPGAPLPDAVLETLQKDGADTDGDGKVTKLPPTPRKRANVKRARSRSAKRSRARS